MTSPGIVAVSAPTVETSAKKKDARYPRSIPRRRHRGFRLRERDKAASAEALGASATRASSPCFGFPLGGVPRRGKPVRLRVRVEAAPAESLPRKSGDHKVIGVSGYQDSARRMRRA
jgi:hypothetical protein